jgi:hypothetical protein
MGLPGELHRKNLTRQQLMQRLRMVGAGALVSQGRWRGRGGLGAVR